MIEVFQIQEMPPSFGITNRSEEHTSELQSRSDLVCRLLLEKKKKKKDIHKQQPVMHSLCTEYFYCIFCLKTVHHHIVYDPLWYTYILPMNLIARMSARLQTGY